MTVTVTVTVSVSVELEERIRGVVRSELDVHLAIEIPSSLVVSERTVKTTDALSEDWLARYRLAARGG